MKQTALQELIEDLQDMCPDYYKNNYNWLHNLLDKEKQQIIDAYNQSSLDTYRKEPKNGQGITYYNETFKK